MTPATHMPRLCGTCLLHSRKDACCTLTGETRRRGDQACASWSDGKMDNNVITVSGGRKGPNE